MISIPYLVAARRRYGSLGASIRQLLGLPTWDSTGKLIPGLWSDGRSSDILLPDNEGQLVAIDGDHLPYEGARWPVNLWPSTDSSATPTTQTITVVSGHEYQLQIGAGSASGATAVCSGAFTGTLTGDAADIQSWDNGTPKTASSTSLTVTISGSVTGIQLENVTGKANQNPSEYQPKGTVPVSISSADPGDWTAYSAVFTQSESIGGRDGVWKIGDAGAYTQIYQTLSGLAAGSQYVFIADVYPVGGAGTVGSLEFNNGAWVFGTSNNSQGTTTANAWQTVRLVVTPTGEEGWLEFYSPGSSVFYVDPASIRCGLVTDGIAVYNTENVNTVDANGVVYSDDALVPSASIAVAGFSEGGTWSIVGDTLVGSGTAALTSKSVGFVAGTYYQVTAHVVGTGRFRLYIGVDAFVDTWVEGEKTVCVASIRGNNDSIYFYNPAGDSFTVSDIEYKDLGASMSSLGVAIYGDSLADGSGDIGGNIDWFARRSITTRRLAAGGSTVAATKAQLDADISSATEDMCLFVCGINDFVNAASNPNTTIQPNIQQMISDTLSAGKRPLLVLPLPWGAHANWTAQKQGWMEEYIAWAKAAYPDYVVDAYAAVEDPANADQLLPGIDNGDGLHLTYGGPELVDAVIGATLGDNLFPAPELAHYPATTNLFTRSVEFDHADWSTSACDATADAALSPKGDVTADLMVPTTSSVSHWFSQSDPVTAGEKYTQSIYAKAGGYSFIQMTGSTGFVSSDTVNIDLTDGTVNYNAQSNPVKVREMVDGWYRIEVTFTAASTVTGRIIMAVLDSGGTTRLPAYAGDGSGGVYVWGAQLEESAFATPLVITEGAPMPRDAVAVHYPYSAAVFNQDSGFAYTDLTPEQAQSALSATDEGILSLADSAASFVYVDSSGFHVTDGTNTATVNPSYAADASIRVLAYWDKDLNVLGIGYRLLPSGSFTFGTEQPYDDAFTTGSNINICYGNEHNWQILDMGMYNKHKDQAYYGGNY